MAPSIFLPDFTQLRAAVVGDLIADHFIYARPARLSREAPVTVFRHESEDVRGGGAANVAANIWTLGASTRLLGIVGDDAGGRDVRRLLIEGGLNADGVQLAVGWATPTKTRVCAAEPNRSWQHVLRLDREPAGPPAVDQRRELCKRVRALAGEVDVLVISDHGYGTVDEELGQAAREVCEAGATAVLNPRRDSPLLEGLTAMMPNVFELPAMAGEPNSRLDSLEGITHCARRILELARPRWLLVTRGNRGMVLFSEEGPAGGTGVPASGARGSVDPTGAGDTGLAAFALSLGAGRDGIEAMRIANAASGVVVLESGTAVCPPSRLRSALPRAPRPRPFPDEEGP